MSAPKVSVIVPAFNEERFIGRCLRSILANSLARDQYEVVVINDCSTDHTQQVLEPFHQDIVLLNNEKNIGLPASLNRGIREAKGQFIVRVDADDFVHGEYLNVLSLHLRMNNGIDAVSCDYLLVDDRQNVIQQVNCLERPIGCAIMYRIEHLIDIGLYDESFKLREDEDLRLRFEKNYSITRVPIPLYKYHIHGENMTLDEDGMRRFKELIEKKHSKT